MTDRQFLWGLANGAVVLALAGAFWLGLGIGMFADHLGGRALAVLTICQVAGLVGLLWGAIRLRRRTRFRRGEFRNATGTARLETRYIMAALRWVVLLQTVLMGVVVGLCIWANADWLVWPSIGVVVSLHFLPLARVFHVPVYYLTGAAGAAVSFLAVALGPTTQGLLVLAGGMTLVMWGSSAFVLVNAYGIAARAIGEVWAVQQRAAPDGLR